MALICDPAGRSDGDAIRFPGLRHARPELRAWHPERGVVYPGSPEATHPAAQTADLPKREGEEFRTVTSFVIGGRTGEAPGTTWLCWRRLRGMCPLSRPYGTTLRG